jgi:hypothetical protein
VYDREIGVWSPVNVMWVEISRDEMDGKHWGRWFWFGSAVWGKAVWALQEVASAGLAGLAGSAGSVGSAETGMNSVQSCRNHQSRQTRRSRRDLGEEIRNHQSRRTRHAACRPRQLQREPWQ